MRKLSPTRQWQLIEVDRTRAAALACRAGLLPLMFPQSSLMDFNISVAFWNAASGRGVIRQPHPAAPAPGGCYGGDGNGGGGGREVCSSARVLLSGLGADEQCVGYKGRHRTKFLVGGWELLAAEVKRDVGRIWVRNLGRDDRVISDH